MASLRANTKNSVRLILDTSTLFSAFYNPAGNEALLFKMADRGFFIIIIIDYVLDELKDIFQRKQIDYTPVIELLSLYDNVEFSSLGSLHQNEIGLSKKIITDPGDRPIFIFAYRAIKSGINAILISGDNGFFTKDVKRTLHGRVMSTREFLETIKT